MSKTIEKLVSASEQELFNEAVAGIIKQGKPAFEATEEAVNGYGDKGRCIYRTADGSKCAFGMLLADEDYRADFENKTADAVVCSLGHAADRDIASKAHYLRCSRKMSLLCDIQKAHDTAANGWILSPGCSGREAQSTEDFLTLFKRNAGIVAARHGLGTEGVL